MKKVLLTLMCLVAMMVASMNLKAQEVTIVLTPGWNWISHPSTDTLDFTTAFGPFTPATGDVIKSRWGQALYTNNRWMGSISQFYPGYGYMYKSNRTVPVMVTFNVQQPVPQVIVTTAEPTDITVNSATCGGNVASSDGNYVFVILRGICWSTSPNPTFNDNYVEIENGLGSFTASMTDLTPNTTYYVRAFAVTATGSFYGDQQSFTTPSYIVNVLSNPTDGGMVTGEGSYEQGQSCTVTATANLGYTFTNWTENGSVVSTDDTYTFTVSANRTMVANFIPTGVINGLFTINENGDQVWFSQGNLQYIGSASTPYWKFADNQWDYLGNSQAGGNLNVNRDLFGWGTSGYNHGAICYKPWNTETENSYYKAYGNYNYNLYDQTGQADWGYNSINNGGSTTNLWRTLRITEWQYLFESRATTSGIRYAKAIVNNVNGIILLPDNWSVDIYILNETNTIGSSYNSNDIAESQWTILENAGAIFLPAAGNRGGATSFISVGSEGCYWSSSQLNYSNAAYNIGFSDLNLSLDWGHSRWAGLSVRLVYDYHP